MLADQQSEWRKFRRWLRKHLEASALTKVDYREEIKRFAPEVDICLGNYHEKGVVNTKFAVHQWDSTNFLSEEEIKKLKKEELPVKFDTPRMPDLNLATRVVTTQEDVKKM